MERHEQGRIAAHPSRQRESTAAKGGGESLCPSARHQEYQTILGEDEAVDATPVADLQGEEGYRLR
eukprot:scaffold13204_cov66-Cyclotella_meneghiniana.AAC.1